MKLVLILKTSLHDILEWSKFVSNKINMFQINYVFICLFSLFSLQINSQCIPEPQEYCDANPVFCSLDVFNGMCCSTIGTSSEYFLPNHCGQDNFLDNPHFWAFTGQSGPITITVNFNNCQNNNGLELGIINSCDKKQILACASKCDGDGTISVSTTISACQSYYFFISGCKGDICDFCVTTSGGSYLQIPELLHINNITTEEVKVCLGTRNYQLKTGMPNPDCNIIYSWTNNGIPFGNKTATQNIIEFKEAGVFEICVQGTLSNYSFFEVCDVTDLRCLKIEVFKSEFKSSIPRYLCFNQSGIYNWFNEIIFYPGGEYKQEFIFGNSHCIIDSVVEFIFLDQDSILVAPKLIGPRDTFCIGDTAIFKTDRSIPLNIIKYNWNADKAIIKTNNHQQKDSVKVQFVTPGLQSLCIEYETLCDRSPKTCKQIYVVDLPTNFAGPDQKVKGFKTVLQANTQYAGKWKLISSPGPVSIIANTNPNATLIVKTSGKYLLRWESSIYNCTHSDEVIIEFTTEKDRDDKGPKRDSMTLQSLDERLLTQEICKRELESIKQGNFVSYNSVRVFSLQGQLVSNTTDNLNPGLYVVQIETEWCTHTFRELVFY